MTRPLIPARCGYPRPVDCIAAGRGASLPYRDSTLGPRQPLAFGKVTVAARVVSDADRTAIDALLDMTAEHRRPARRDGAHDP